MAADWVIFAGIAGAILTPIVSAFRLRSDARKSRQDGTASLMTSTGALLTSVQDEMQEMRTELRALRSWRMRVEGMWRAHSRWDDHVVAQLTGAGIPVADPPPLFESDDK